MEILLTGDLIDAERAERIGLVNRVVPDAELREKTQQLAVASPPTRHCRARGEATVRLVAEHPLSAAYQEAERMLGTRLHQRGRPRGTRGLPRQASPCLEGTLT